LKNLFLIFGLWWITGLAGAQPAVKAGLASGLAQLPGLLQPDLHLDSAQKAALAKRLTLFVAQLRQQRTAFSSENSYLAHVHRQVHGQYLRQYQALAGVGQLLADGQYNCLSGSAIFALVLQELGYPAQVYQTKRHAYVRLPTRRGTEYLIEATDPEQGLTYDPAEVKARLAVYRRQGLAPHEEAAAPTLADWPEVIGLLFYNQAVRHFNAQAYEPAMRALEQAAQYGQSSRATEAMLVTIRASLRQQDLAPDQRAWLLSQHRTYAIRLSQGE
jgi:hypothetical protein